MSVPYKYPLSRTTAQFRKHITRAALAVATSMSSLGQTGTINIVQACLRSFTMQESTPLTYQRSKAFCNAYGTPPCFWKMHREALVALDGGAFTLFVIQCNPFASTLAPFAMKRPELQPVLQAALGFNVSAQFVLTEVNHGLDARSVQTTAILCEMESLISILLPQTMQSKMWKSNTSLNHD
ncbi:Acyl-CoA dehydrogenase/oxidase [Penicillium antarcticum]|uniref:Acyl-CoA dehydrogenase/oxidase n=1 Tax=Penicillium antarcticum TaxID=416450 RepID=UPI00238AF4C0|nr:Acyl-CoA dehydrogenase/oxidase [Penicillium antarcticum]KAJ5316602.1 Acyl-CoA dehydrogenase/oxidase [Penicillium antarcticum]